MTIRIVVAGAVIDAGRLLLAQRTYPAAVAGRWELPGGKCEYGEGPAQALTRELAEELSVTVRAGEPLDGEVVLAPELVLIALRAELCRGTPTSNEHSALRWVDAETLRVMAVRGEMVPADTLWVDQLCALLDAPGSDARA